MAADASRAQQPEQSADREQRPPAPSPGLETVAAPVLTGSADLAALTDPRFAPRANDPRKAAVVQALQRSHGNASVQRLLAQRRPTEPVAEPDVDGLARAINGQREAGTPLPPDTRDALEAGLGVALPDLRVHTSAEADRLARSVDATAFTSGNDVFFRGGAYAPGTADGLRTLAHEAAHTVQQARGPVAGTPTGDGVSISDPADAFERTAARAATAVVEGGAVPDLAGELAGAPATVARTVAVQRDGGGPAAPAPAPAAPAPAPPGEMKKEAPGPGKRKPGEQVGTWGVYAQTRLTIKAKETQDFGNQEAAIVYARGLQKAACVFEEDGRFVVYTIDYSWLSGFSSFTYSGTRLTRNSPISDVKGVPGVLAFATEDGVAILPHQYGSEADYKSWMDQQDTLKPGENPFDAHKEAFGVGLGKTMGRDKFLHQFEMAMRDLALSTLDKSKVEAEQKQKDVAAGGDLAKMQPVLNRLVEQDKKINSQKYALSAPRKSYPLTDEEKAAREEKIAELTRERKRILFEYPLLSQIDEPWGTSYEESIPSVEFNARSDAEKTARLGQFSSNVLENITQTRTNVISGELNLWKAKPLVDGTLAGLAISDKERVGWVNEKVQIEKASGEASKTLMMLLQVGLSALAMAFTGGVAGVAFAAAAGAVTLKDAIDSTEDVAARDAAANTDINKDKALVPADLNGEWAMLVVNWVGVGLTFMEAVSAVRAIKGRVATLDAARAGGAIEEEIGKLAKAPNRDATALREAAGLAGKIPPTEDALRKTLLSALPSDELRTQFKDMVVRIVDDNQFVKEFGSQTGEAVTTFTKGEKGELIPQVHFKKSGNPLAMREEAVHVAQSADPKMAAKMAELSETNMLAWKQMDTTKQLQTYRTKLEVEIDAQKRLLAQFAGGDERYLAGVNSTLDNLTARLDEVNQAIKDPAAFEKSKPPWWDPEQPPRLFGKRAPSEWWGEWSGRPGNSEWIDERPEVQKYTGKDRGIVFRNWNPDFSEWAVMEVEIEMSGLADDFAAADAAAARKQMDLGNMEYAYRGEPNASAVARWRKGPPKYTWHHVRGGKKMQLIPHELHSKIAHEGGAAEARAAARGE